nr:isoflavone 3'-hydroxylase-like [Tanacetum cinerariifolium]
VLLSAGTDTSSGTMEWMLSHLLNNPEALKKAHAEIDSYVGDNRLVNESDLPNLPYLRCIINETMRINPPGPLVFHESAKNCIVRGYHIPSGTMLLMNLWAMQNDPKNWEDPKKFKPERFVGLEGSRDGYKLMPFGAGRRRCPAENMAMRMVGLASGTLIQCFESHLPLTQPTQVNKVTTSWEICSGPHDTQYCMEDLEQAFIEYASSRTDKAKGKWYTFKTEQNNLGDTYNPSWRSHPNLRRRQPQNSQNNFSNPPNLSQPNGLIQNHSFNKKL